MLGAGWFGTSPMLDSRPSMLGSGPSFTLGPHVAYLGLDTSHSWLYYVIICKNNSHKINKNKIEIFY